MATRYFYYKTGSSHVKINLRRILYLEANDNYVKFCWYSRKRNAFLNHTVRISLEDVLTLLPQGDFLRICRSYAISMEQVVEFGRDYALFRGVRLEFTPSRTHYEEFLKNIRLLEVADKKGNLQE